MDSVKITENLEALNILKKDSRRAQKRGLPFMMASVMLMPLAFGFSKLIRADVFRKSKNPIDQLGFLCTMNQMLYLVIVMWAFSQKPEAMVIRLAFGNVAMVGFQTGLTAASESGETVRVAFSYAWLVLCTVVWALASGKEGISASFLLKLFYFAYGAYLPSALVLLTGGCRRKGSFFR